VINDITRSYDSMGDHPKPDQWCQLHVPLVLMKF